MQDEFQVLVNPVILTENDKQFRFIYLLYRNLI